MGEDQVCCHTSYNAKDSPPQQGLTWPRVLRLRNPYLGNNHIFFFFLQNQKRQAAYIYHKGTDKYLEGYTVESGTLGKDKGQRLSFLTLRTFLMTNFSK